MGSLETSREPCPDRILDDTGGAFCFGAVGGSAFYFLKGGYNSPRGERLLRGLQTVRMNVPRLGGSWAVYGGLISVVDCSMVYIRQKEDPWNSITAGAAAGGFLQMRQGFGSAARYAAFGGVLFALAEGAFIMLNKMSPVAQNIPMEEPIPIMAGGPGFLMEQQPLPVSTLPPDSTGDSSSSKGFSLFGGFFGTGDKKKETSSRTGSTGSISLPPPPKR